MCTKKGKSFLLAFFTVLNLIPFLQYLIYIHVQKIHMFQYLIKSFLICVSDEILT